MTRSSTGSSKRPDQVLPAETRGQSLGPPINRPPPGQLPCNWSGDSGGEGVTRNKHYLGDKPGFVAVNYNLYVKPDDRWEVNNLRQQHLDRAEALEQTLRDAVANEKGVPESVIFEAIEAALAGNRMIFLATQKALDVENPTPDDIHAIGTVGIIMRMLKLPDERIKILVQGLSKAKISG